MKAPTHVVPSGDRHVARLLMRVLRSNGHRVELASIFRSWEGKGDTQRQRRLKKLGKCLAERLIRRYRTLPSAERPCLWMTYHLFHKAPDWLGPSVSRALGIPYVIAEASYAPKQSNGPWSIGHEAAGEAIARADAVIALNSADVPCIVPLLGDPQRVTSLKPFLDTAEYGFNGDRRQLRASIQRRYSLDPNIPWLLSVAMMREGRKLHSFQILGEALQCISDRRWCLLVVGDGPARPEVEAAFAGLDPRRVKFTGLLSPEALKTLYATADLFVWPAIREPFGMSLLEAQASGLAVVAARTGGVPDIVSDEVSGLLVSEGDPKAFARAVSSLIANPSSLRAMGRAARQRAAREHDVANASHTLERLFRRLFNGAPG